jgi:hypothetical protein
MGKQPLDYQNAMRDRNPTPQVRWQTIVACSLLGLALLCVLAALVWPQRRPELISAAITLGIGGVIIYFPYIRT